MTLTEFIESLTQIEQSHGQLRVMIFDYEKQKWVEITDEDMIIRLGRKNPEPGLKRDEAFISIF